MAALLTIASLAGLPAAALLSMRSIMTDPPGGQAVLAGNQGYGYQTTAPPATPPPTSPPATTPPPTSPPAETPPVPTPETGSGGGELPVTGVGSLAVVGAGLVLVGIGIVIWVLAGRSTRDPARRR